MSTHVETIGSPGRPRHIRYFEFLQVGIIGILLAIQFVGAGERLIFNLATFGPIAAVLLGLTLAVSRGRQNWARWVLLIIFIYCVVAGVRFALLMPGVPLLAGIVAVLLVAGSLGAVLSLAFTKQSSTWIRGRNGKIPFQIAMNGAMQPQPSGALRWPLIAKLRLDDHAALAWTLTSGGGAAAGAWLACLVFPSARFAQNLTGHFTWALVGFASFVGLGFGLAQSLALAHHLKCAADRQQPRTGLVVLAWLIATAAGVFAMIFPLWWTDAEALLLAPGYMLAVMTPGVLLLAVLQGALIRLSTSLKGWLWRTAVAGAIGAYLSLFTAMILGAGLPLPIEALWAGSFGLVIGAAQAKLIGELHFGTSVPPKQEVAASNSMVPAHSTSAPVGPL